MEDYRDAYRDGRSWQIMDPHRIHKGYGVTVYLSYDDADIGVDESPADVVKIVLECPVQFRSASLYTLRFGQLPEGEDVRSMVTFALREFGVPHTSDNVWDEIQEHARKLYFSGVF